MEISNIGTCKYSIKQRIFTSNGDPFKEFHKRVEGIGNLSVSHKIHGCTYTKNEYDTMADYQKTDHVDMMKISHVIDKFDCVCFRHNEATVNIVIRVCGTVDGDLLMRGLEHGAVTFCIVNDIHGRIVTIHAIVDNQLKTAGVTSICMNDFDYLNIKDIDVL